MSAPFTQLNAHDVVSKAYARMGEGLDNMRHFQQHLGTMLASLDHEESEENAKNHVRDFLKAVWYQSYQVNTRDRIDLVVHKGEKADAPVGIVLEAKRPANKGEFPKQNGTQHNLHCKALYELLYYYLDLHEQGQRQVCHLVITNGYCWYVLDENAWADAVLRNKKLLEDFRYYSREKRTDEFYGQIAKPFFEQLKQDIPFVFVDFRTCQELLSQAKLSELNPALQREYTLLYKLFSPQHLLKLTFQNTGNQLDKGFYLELLHILGLQEVLDNETGKLLITRLPAGQREAGSLLENAIARLRVEGLLRDLDKDYGTTEDDRFFNAAMELVITWLNRILFLKLMEAQLLRYHEGDSTHDYAFLAPKALKDFDELNTLFFDVLAIKPQNRPAEMARWQHIPYLNSSLFEVSALERKTLRISNLSDSTTLNLFPGTVLKDDQGRREQGNKPLPTLHYLLRFLDAYNFSSEGGGEIREDNKSLVSAKVLGLFFEKINGYRDGSVYTPGYITEYMCRVSLRELIIQRFNEAFSIEASDWNELCNWAYANTFKNEVRLKANGVINSLRICDPSVGSGHFLVSVLNELLACKSELRVLGDEQKAIPVNIVVTEDEITIQDVLLNEPFQYKADSAGEKLRIQRVLFHEKQYLIENCLFGVDINPNSVKICCLRLWIELLKHAYYHNDELQTLPNLDINIKEGNSLLSRVPLRSELTDPKMQRLVNEYRGWVQDYKNTTNREVKYGLELKIKEAVSKIKEPLRKTDPRRKQLEKLSAELYLAAQPRLLDTPLTAKQQEQEKKRLQKLEAEVEALNLELRQEEESLMYRKAMEWRFAFPEVLNEVGDFTGFDFVVGNPPYIRQEELGELKVPLARDFEVFAGTADMYQYFFELGLRLCKPNGQMAYIVANKWMLAAYGEALRRFLDRQTVLQIVDFGDLPVFDAATTYPCIIRIRPLQHSPEHEFPICKVKTLKYETNLEDYITENQRPTLQAGLKAESWILADKATLALLDKLGIKGMPLGEYVKGKIYYGIKTGYNKAFVIDAATRAQLIAEDAKSAEVIKPFLAGKDIKRYQKPQSDKFLIFTRRGIDIERYPAIKRHLEAFRTGLEPRPKDWKPKTRYETWPGRKPGSYPWYEIQDSIDYWQEFEKPKIIYPNILRQPEFCIDKESLYTNQKCFIIGVEDYALLAILNSSVIFFLMRHILPKLRGDFYEPSSVFFTKFPIPHIPATANKELSKLSKAVMKQLAESKDTTALEQTIDQLVYQLYDLTEEEVRLVEGQG